MIMAPGYVNALYRRIRTALDAIPIVDTHEHLQRESELPQGDNIHIGRFFIHYANCDLVSAGMPLSDMARVQNDVSLAPKERFALLEPWYRKAWNTAYCESLRMGWRDLYGVEDLTADTAEMITERMRIAIKDGWTRRVFDKAGIDYALNHPFGPKVIFNPDFNPACFICDMTDGFTELRMVELAQESGIDILCLDDYLKLIDWYFEQYAARACAFKIIRAYDRSLYFEDVPKSVAEDIFNRRMAFSAQNEFPGRKETILLEDFLMHYLCRKCGEYGLRMKFHTGLQEGNGNVITNSRAALLANLFLKYPKTGFDIFHISYPYQDEAITLVKNFANVTMDFCWMWIINPAAGRRALSEMLDTLPASKIHGFGGDYIFVEGTYGHAQIARREIARVLCAKVEEGRFSETYAVQVGRMLLRDNAIENFGLEKRRGTV
jgi:uncharacterized protein